MQGCSRWIWNHWLDLNQKHYAADGKFIWYHQMCKSLPALKQQHQWLKQCYSQVLQQSLKSLDTALRSCGKKQAHRKGFPKFRSRHTDTTGICFTQHTRIQAGKIYLPKTGWIVMKQCSNQIGVVSCTSSNSWSGLMLLMSQLLLLSLRPHCCCFSS